MVKVCASGKRKVKATKAMPAKWRQMDDRQRAFILAHMSIPREIVKCCGPCFKRISKKLDLVIFYFIVSKWFRYLQFQKVFDFLTS